MSPLKLDNSTDFLLFSIPSIELNLNGFWTKNILVVGIFPFSRDFHSCQRVHAYCHDISLVLFITYRHLVNHLNNNSDFFTV